MANNTRLEPIRARRRCRRTGVFAQVRSRPGDWRHDYRHRRRPGAGRASDHRGFRYVHRQATPGPAGKEPAHRREHRHRCGHGSIVQGGKDTSRRRQRVAHVHGPTESAKHPMAAPRIRGTRPARPCSASPPPHHHAPRLNSGRFLSDCLISVGRRALHDRRCAGPVFGFGDFSDPDARGSGAVGTYIPDMRCQDFVDPSHVRIHAQSRANFECLPRGDSLYGETRIAANASTAHICADHIMTPLPGCLRPPSLTIGSTASVHRRRSPRRHAPADPTAVDYRSL